MRLSRVLLRDLLISLAVVCMVLGLLDGNWQITNALELLAVSSGGGALLLHLWKTLKPRV